VCVKRIFEWAARRAGFINRITNISEPDLYENIIVAMHTLYLNQNNQQVVEFVGPQNI